MIEYRAMDLKYFVAIVNLLLVPKAKDGDKVTKKQKCSGCPFYKTESIIEFRDRTLVSFLCVSRLNIFKRL